MRADRYLRFILTVIAVELLWLGVREAAPPAHAQQTPQAVIVTGFRIGKQDYTTLPVVVVGSLRPSSIPLSSELPGVQPLSTRVSDPVQIEARGPLPVAASQPLPVQVANQPLTVQSGTKPVVVDVMPAKPGLRPGI